VALGTAWNLMMLKKLRWQLSALYVLAATALVLLIGAGAYGMLSYYFKSSTDLALRYKVAQEYIKLGQPIPGDLQAADRAWQKKSTPAQITFSPSSHDEGEVDSEQGTPSFSYEGGEETYDSELASIFILPINTKGQLISTPNVYTLSFQPDSQAVEAALGNGSDLRTVRLADGSLVRLFTYRVSNEYGLSVLQVGRSLDDQERLLHQMWIGLVVIGSFSILVVGVSSWWLAGRSLIPAEQAWDRQQIFIANASHELRTPLTLLRASAEVTQRSLDAQDSRYELLDDILTETDHMSRLVEDLLLLSRLDAGQLKLKLEPILAEAFLNDMAREMGRVTDKQGIILDVLHAEGVVLADPTRLRQVLLILLDNALRHTFAGGAIHLAVRISGHLIEWQVSDTGSGISAEDLPHVFERFYREETDRSQPNDGSGLGMAIAKGLVEAMHGQIAILSQPGKGTQVTFTLPASNM
jgi:signal transduction histidine kinase